MKSIQWIGPEKEPILYSGNISETRNLWEVLPDGSWAGHRCFIIGGGPSLIDFNWQLLKGERSIGINRAYEKYDPTIIFSMDTRFLSWIERLKYGKEAFDRFQISKAYKVWLLTYNAKLPSGIFKVRVYENYQAGFSAFPRSMRNGIGHGNNSGYGALNLAVCLGANPIYLLGFDMKHDIGATHWHGGHPQPQPASKLENYIGYLKPAAERIAEYGIEVINLNPDSALEWFPKMKLKEVLH